MQIIGKITEADYIRAQYLHLRPRRLFAIVGIFVSILLLTFAVGVAIIEWSWTLAIALAFFPLYFGVFLPFTAKRNFRSYKSLAEQTSIELRADGLFFRRKNGEGLVPWSDIIKWRKNERLVLMYPARNIVTVHPAGKLRESRPT